MVALDTNVFVRFLVDTPDGGTDQVRRARVVVAAAEGRGKDVLVTHVVLVETVWVLRKVYKVPKREVIEAFRAVLASAGFVVEDVVAVPSAPTPSTHSTANSMGTTGLRSPDAGATDCVSERRSARRPDRDHRIRKADVDADGPADVGHVLGQTPLPVGKAVPDHPGMHCRARFQACSSVTAGRDRLSNPRSSQPSTRTYIAPPRSSR